MGREPSEAGRTTVIQTPALDVFLEHATGVFRFNVVDAPRPALPLLRAQLEAVIDRFDGHRRGRLRMIVDLRRADDELKALVEELEDPLFRYFRRIAFLGYAPAEDDDTRLFVTNDEDDAIAFVHGD